MLRRKTVSHRNHRAARALRQRAAQRVVRGDAADAEAAPVEIDQHRQREAPGAYRRAGTSFPSEVDPQVLPPAPARAGRLQHARACLVGFSRLRGGSRNSGSCPARAMRCRTERMAGVSSGNCGRNVTRGLRRVLRLAYSAALHRKGRDAMAFIYYVTQIQFDFGAIQLLRQECQRVGISQAADRYRPGRQGGRRAAEGAGCAARPAPRGLRPDPSNPTEAACAPPARSTTQRCDGLIAVGGGSAIDCAKGVAIAANHEGR